MAHAFQIKKGDLLPTLQRQLVDDDGDPVDLSTASHVSFHMRASGAASGFIATRATILNATQGQVEYAWAAPQTATPGYYEAEWQVMWPASKPQTIPNIGFIPVVVIGDIA